MASSWCCFVPLILVSFSIHLAKFGGTRGTVQLVSSQEDIQWILHHGPDSPYVPLLPLIMFNGQVLESLKKSSRVSGMLVMANGTSGQADVPDDFSPDKPCPNQGFGLASSSANCLWNVNGTSLAYESFSFPVFAIRQDSDVQALLDCYNNHNVRANGVAPDPPLCSAELNDFMYAVRDTYTCMRQAEVSTSLSGTSERCDPLQGKNVWGTLEAKDRKAGNYADRSVIMVITRMDANSFFHDVSPGAETSTSGLVTLLAAIEALGQAKRKFGEGSPVNKTIVFAVFNGESFDYIGSSRMVWEMKEKTFPPNPPSDKNKMFPAPLKLSHIDTIIEFAQTGLSDSPDSIFMHFDKNANSTDSVRGKLLLHGRASGLTLNNGSGRLPPASLQRFLAEDKAIAGVVLADHDDHYTNRYYNSFFDDADNLKGISSKDPAASDTTMQITRLATATARTLYELAEEKEGAIDASELVVNSSYVHELLQCFTLNFTCDRIRQVLSQSSIKVLQNSTGANPRYIGPNSAANHQVVSAISAFLAHSVGTSNNVTSQSACSNNSTDLLNNYFWMQQQYASAVNTDNRGVCVVAPVLLHTALSPAFDLKDYRSTKYSTWAESRWKTLSLRIYLAPGSKSQRVTFGIGCLVIILSFLIVYQVNRVSSALFVST